MTLLTNITLNALITWVLSWFITMSMSLFLTITASMVAGDYITAYLIRRSIARRNLFNQPLRLN